MQRFFLATNDVESTSIRFNKQRKLTAEKVMREGMPALLALYREFGIKATFFYTGEIAEQYPDLVRQAMQEGHEIACHGYSHEDRFAFDQLGYNDQVNQLRKAKKILEDITGEEVISFRAPALRVNEFTAKALETVGFQIDSSISSQRADNFLSFGALKKMNRLWAPRLPYYTAKNNLAHKGNSSILEIPISALLVPYIGTVMRIAPSLTMTLAKVLHKEAVLTGKPINFLIHPNECINEEDEDIMERRSANFIQYLLAEKIRHGLKQKNLGSIALQLYRQHLEFFHKQGYAFCTLKQYKQEISK